MASTTIVIPGRETQTIEGLVMAKTDVIAAFAGDIDLSGMVATEEREGSDVTITFANRTGTKGSDVNVTINVEGDLNISGTKIVIPGRETQEIPGVVMGADEIIAAFAGDIDLSQMVATEEVEEDFQVVSFANRTGTKGSNNVMEAIFAAVKAAAEEQAEEDEEDDFNEDQLDLFEEEVEELEDEPVATSTRIVIPGREDQLIPGMVMDVDMVKGAFAGEIDLSGYTVTESLTDGVKEIRFAARTGTKG